MYLRFKPRLFDSPPLVVPSTSTKVFEYFCCINSVITKIFENIYRIRVYKTPAAYKKIRAWGWWLFEK